MTAIMEGCSRGVQPRWGEAPDEPSSWFGARKAAQGVPESVIQGRAGSPLPAARPNAIHGAHGVTRPTNVPIPFGKWYHLFGAGRLLLICLCLAWSSVN